MRVLWLTLSCPAYQCSTVNSFITLSQTPIQNLYCGCLEGIWRFLEGVWKCLQGVWKVFNWCLLVIEKVSGGPKEDVRKALKNFGPRIFWNPNVFGPNFSQPKFFQTQISFKSKSFWTKIFSDSNFFWPKILVSNIYFKDPNFLTQFFFTQIFFDWKTKNILDLKVYFWPQIISDPIFFAPIPA